jgi:TBC1 domain family protein 5
MRQLATALSAWEELGKYSNLKALKSAVFEAKDELAVVTGLRSVCWKVRCGTSNIRQSLKAHSYIGIQIFLLFQNLDRASWPASLYNSRSAYESLRAHYLRAIEHPDEVGTAADPLDTDAEV